MNGGAPAPRSDASGAPRHAPSAAVIATGDELTSGLLVDGNSSSIARRLSELGWTVQRMCVLGDDEDGLCLSILELARTNRLIVVTGGLGPTLDDVTRHALARAAGVELVLDEASLAEVRTWFESRGRAFAQSNQRQALFPAGARILKNPLGTAPGFSVRVGEAHVFALPGPPREMLPMLEAEVVPALASIAPHAAAIEVRRFYLFGLAESAFADGVGRSMARDANPLVGVTSKNGTLSVSLKAHGATREIARETAERASAEFRARFQEWIVSETEPDIAFVVGQALIAREITVAVAESCTGGLVAAKLTAVPGISRVFHAGFVTYSNRAKTEMLGVDAALIAAHGAVSSEVAGAMALGAARKAGARAAISVTGIAGPDGGTAEKPVGLVWFGVVVDRRLTTVERRFTVRGRELIREFAANTALELLRRALG